MRGRLLLTFALAALACPAAAVAQSPLVEDDGVAPAHVAHVEGVVTLEREGRADPSPLNVPLLSGDRLRTADGRVEVLFADGSTLHLDARSTLDVQSDDLVRLIEGRMRLNLVGPARMVAYRIDSPAGSARITQQGEYRIAVLRRSEETQLEVAVLRGEAEVFTDQGTTPIRAGERAYASAGLAPSYAYAYNSANWDAFDRWSEDRRDVRLGVSSQYLPSDLQEYAPLLDESGDWRYDQAYGNVWYPRVAADWRPYYNGRWDSYPHYGWTWIGTDRFAWPTHHYGRWGFSAGVWFWIPSSRWAPAHVSWAYAPGYVSWCPLGFDNRPVIAVDLYRVGPNYYSPWRAWTVVSASHFGGRGAYVNQRAVNWDRVAGQRPRFESRPSAPASTRGVAAASPSTRAHGGPSNAEGRNATPIRWAGSRSLPLQAGNPAISRRTGEPPRGTSAVSNPPRDGGRSTAADRQADATSRRYINRGDEIVRSQTERPTPRATPRPDAGATPVRRAGEARPSVNPAFPARSDEPRSIAPAREPGPRVNAGAARVPPRAEPRTERAQDRAASTDHPAYRPSYQPHPSPASPYEPRGYEPRTPSPARDVMPPREASVPATPAAAPRAEPPGGGVQVGSAASAAPRREREAAPERTPNRADGRQPPPERAAPAPGRAEGQPHPAPAAGGVAVPRRGRGGA